MPQNLIDEILAIIERGANVEYNNDVVTQKEHALQAAWAAEKAGASAALVSAALLHDIGHMLHDLPADAAEQGIDDVHEVIGQRWLNRHFGPEVTEPVRLHVDAKRYLCSVDPDYHGLLTAASVRSLALQGGPFDAEQLQAFEANPYYREAVELRRWDEAAKIPGLATPEPEHFRPHLEMCMRQKALQ